MSNTSSPATNVATLPQQNNSQSLVGKIAAKFGVEPLKLWDTLKATAFSQRNGQAPTNEQMMALLVVADQYGLNPFTKEIYAFPDQQNGIVPVVGVDGWSRIINTHKQFDGMEFRTSESTVQLKGLPNPVFEWIECIMYRKDRERPTVIREYMEEIYREPFEKKGSNGPYVIKGPWQTHPRRFARHKVLIQTARICLGYTGIYDQDEAERIIDESAIAVSKQPAIEFDMDDDNQEALTASKPQDNNQILDDVANATLSGFDNDYEEAEYSDVQHEQQQPQQQEYEAMPNIHPKDQKMISQMIQFTVDTGAWDTTKDSFMERYSDETLEYALTQLKSAFNATFSES